MINDFKQIKKFITLYFIKTNFFSHFQIANEFESFFVLLSIGLILLFGILIMKVMKN